MTERTFDVVVVGSGAAGMAAAIAAADGGGSVLLLEKSPHYGGTTALSGGGTWVPNNHLMDSIGESDTPEDALTYLKTLIGNEVNESRLVAYVKNAPRVMSYFEEKTAVKFSVTSYPDYYPEKPGSKKGGRTLQPLPFNAKKLKKSFTTLAPPNVQTLMAKRMQLTMEEARSLMLRKKNWQWMTARIVLTYYLDIISRLKSKRDRRLTLGAALCARLRFSLQQRKVTLWLNMPVHELLIENNKACGVVAGDEDKAITIKARRGVILAAGGFERNKEMRALYHAPPSNPEWSAGHSDNTGEGIHAALAHGAASDLMNAAWWTPAVHIKGRRAQPLFIERALPGCLIVNRNGKRFVREAAPYLDVGQAMYDTGAIPAFIIFDATFRKVYPCGPLLPSSVQPDAALSASVKDYVKRADTLAALAQLLGIDQQNLEATAAQSNQNAASGTDSAWHNGESFYDRYYGDAKREPNPCLGLLEKAPFYGFEIYPGDIGTKGGLLTDEHARVLHQSGEVMGGLYAAGNNSASVMGRSYPGAGVTIGPALVFGFLAGEHLMGKSDE